MKHRCKYEYTSDFGNARHAYYVVGARGALHFHVSDMGEDWEKKVGKRYSAGLELHYSSPPVYMRDDAPSQERCWLLNGPCWHDGTSLYAMETLVPRWLAAQGDHDAVFRLLTQEYDKRMGETGEAEVSE